MFVLRATMLDAVATERQRFAELAHRYGGALERVTALQKQFSAWVLNKPEFITPEQAAQMFYAQDDTWQATFFNCMQDQVRAHHDALPPARPGAMPTPSAGYPAGEGQWYHFALKLNDEGFETIEAMFDHAKYARENKPSNDLVRDDAQFGVGA